MTQPGYFPLLFATSTRLETSKVVLIKYPKYFVQTKSSSDGKERGDAIVGEELELEGKLYEGETGFSTLK